MAARSFRSTRRASVLTDVEVRYNITDQLQFAIGANNLFNIRPDIQPYAQNGVLTSSVTALNGNNAATRRRNPGRQWQREQQLLRRPPGIRTAAITTAASRSISKPDC